MQSSLTDCEAKLIKMHKDCIRMREALVHIALQLDGSASIVLERIPHIIEFANAVIDEGGRPGFESFIREKLDAAASG
jgi:hypothetical protein